MYFVPNRGNWGDALIRHSTLQFFRDIHLNVQELKPTSWRLRFPGGGTAIYGGGGGWCRLWDHSARMVAALASRVNVIVLPSTYEIRYDIPRTTFFCRDRFESSRNMPGASFCHDMAFYAGKEDGPCKGSGTGYFFRRDRESTGKISIPAGNRDLSAQGDHVSDIAPFRDEINKFACIHTDRLHVAITACLLGKEVHFYPGAYFKNRAVYLSSMRGYFDNVRFHAEGEA